MASLTLAEFFDKYELGPNPRTADAARRLGARGFCVGIHRHGRNGYEWIGLVYHSITELDLLALHGPGSYRLTSHWIDNGGKLDPREVIIVVVDIGLACHGNTRSVLGLEAIDMKAARQATSRK